MLKARKVSAYYCHSRLRFVYFQDYEKSGVFAAQSQLELRQKQEEDELYATFKREKAKKIEKIEKELETEKERSVKEMIESYEQLKKHRDQESLESEKRKLEVLYR